jgi:hypothetical protein
MILQRVCSGGQTGVDRAALDVAAAAGIEIGGWCPAGRRSESGPLPSKYPLTETPSRAYRQRTQWNIRDSDATLVLALGPLTGGTRLTCLLTKQYARPLMIRNMRSEMDACPVADWIETGQFGCLNVAGPRASGAAGIYMLAREFLSALFNELKSRHCAC